MDSDLAHHIRFDELSLASFRDRPALHRHQIAATEAHLEVAHASTSALDLLARLAAAGRTCDLARAAWCDRHENLARALRALGDDDVAATVDAGVAAVAVTSDSDFLQRLVAASTAIERRRADAWAAAATVVDLAMTAIDWATAGGDGIRGDHATVISQLWERAREHDRQLTWTRVLHHPPYRHRVPFDDAQIAEIGRWIARAIGQPIDQPPAQRDEPAPPALPALPPLTAPEPSVRPADEAVQPYRDALAALAPDDATVAASCDLYRRALDLAASCTSAPEWLARAAAEGLLVRLACQPHIDRAIAAAARADQRGQPHLAQHQRALATALDTCATTTEVEHVLATGALIIDIEIAWHDLLVHAVTRPVQAIAAVEAEDQPWRRRAVAESLTVLTTLLGITLPEALAAPRIAILFERVYLPLGQQITLAPGALEADYGEVGLRPINDLRAATARALTDQVLATSPPEDIGARLADAFTRPRFTTASALRDHFVDHCATIAPSPPPSPARLLLWGTPVTLAELHELDLPSRRPSLD